MLITKVLGFCGEQRGRDFYLKIKKGSPIGLPLKLLKTILVFSDFNSKNINFVSVSIAIRIPLIHIAT